MTCKNEVCFCTGECLKKDAIDKALEILGKMSDDEIVAATSKLKSTPILDAIKGKYLGEINYE